MRFRIQHRGGPEVGLSDAVNAEGGAISSREAKRQLTTGGRVVLGLFFAVFLAVGVGTTYTMAVKPWAAVVAARTWTPVSCRILSSEVKEHESSDSTTYSVGIRYVYHVGGRRYEGDRYDFTVGSSSGRKSKKEIVNRYRAGSTATCYVNPQNPQEAVMERARIRDWGFGLIPLVFVFIGAAGVSFAIFGKKKPGGSDWRAGDGESFRRGKTSGALRGRTDYSDEAGQIGAGPVELKPASSRIGTLVGFSFFAVFWNGIVSVFVVNMVGEAVSGSWVKWLFLLFLVPFVGIGLFLIGLVVRQAMALANPVPRITVNRAALGPGDVLEISWRFDGKVGRLRGLEIFLEGREEATYRRGTDTRTDKDVFAKLPIALVHGLISGEPGNATLRLPARMMHSFKSANNAVRWSLCLKGDIARWPDVDESFQLKIVPRPHAPASLKQPRELS